MDITLVTTDGCFYSLIHYIINIFINLIYFWTFHNLIKSILSPRVVPAPACRWSTRLQTTGSRLRRLSWNINWTASTPWLRRETRLCNRKLKSETLLFMPELRSTVIVRNAKKLCFFFAQDEKTITTLMSYIQETQEILNKYKAESNVRCNVYIFLKVSRNTAS